MDSPKEEVKEIRGRSLRPGELTIMVIRSVGRIRSFKISSKIILWACIFFLAYILVSIYVCNRFFELRHLYNIQSEKLESLEKILNQNEKALLQTKQYATELDEYLKNYNNIQKERGISSATLTSDDTITVNPVMETLVKKSDGEETSDKIVDIKDISILNEDSGMTVDFKLVNARSEDTAAEGYIHIIAVDNNKNYPQEWNDTRDQLKNGVPINFRRGQPFLIQRFRPYSRQFNINSNSELPAVIKILVYSRSGELILNREFDTSNAS